MYTFEEWKKNLIIVRGGGDIATVVVSESTYADRDQCDCTGKSSGSVPDIEKDGN